MTRSPLIPTLALLLAACGGGGGNPDDLDGVIKNCSDGSTVLQTESCPDDDDTDGDNNTDTGTETGDTITGGPSPVPSIPAPRTIPGTYEALRDRILAASNPAALAGALDPTTLTANQYDALFELALTLDPESPESDRATARQIMAIDNWPELDDQVADRTINLGTDNPALTRLHAAYRAELVTREATHSAFLAPNRRADVPGTLVPKPTVLGSDAPPDTAGLYYAVWMNPVGTIHRWQNRAADAIYTRTEIQTIAPENRTGADGATVSFRGTASGFAAHTDGTAGAMTANVALTLAFGIDSADGDRFDVAPALTGTIDDFRLVGQTGDLGWTARIDGDLRDDGTVDSGDIVTGKPPYLVGNVNDLSVAFSTDRVAGPRGSTTLVKTHPPTHAAGSFDLTFTDGRAAGAFAIPREVTSAVP